jgi:ATP adenylyltransferase
LEYLWSPWRMEYIMSEKDEGHCTLCVEAAKPDGLENLVVYHGKRVFLILNRFPYTSGHIMVVPFEHCASLEQLDSATMTELMEITAKSLVVLRKVYRPEGYNIGMNIGEVSGAGITDHVHIHVVPRWGGDTNFMSTLASTRVLPETLEDTFTRIRKAWEDSQ